MFEKTIEVWENLKGAHTAREISQQPSTWLKTYDIILNNRNEIKDFVESVTSAEDFDVIFTGAGTSEFVGNSLAPLLVEKLNFNVQSIATTDIVATPRQFIHPTKPTLVVSFGRSGNSPESIGAVEIIDTINPNAKHLIITCNHQGKLALAEEDNILAIKLPTETNDQSFAMTSSYSNMFFAALLVFNIDVMENYLPSIKEAASAAEKLLTEDFQDIINLIEDFDFKRIVYLGDAGLAGVAEESSLKMLELTAGDVVTMFNTPLGFRHGPKSIINNDTLVVVLMSHDEYTRPYQIDLIKEMSAQRKNNKLIAIDSRVDESIKPLVDAYYTIKYEDEVNPDVIGLNMVVYAQIFSLYKSLHLGKTPDNPWPSGEVNRVVQGVTLYPYKKEN